jgi:hypothetical protein
MSLATSTPPRHLHLPRPLTTRLTLSKKSVLLLRSPSTRHFQSQSHTRKHRPRSPHPPAIHPTHPSLPHLLATHPIHPYPLAIHPIHLHLLAIHPTHPIHPTRLTRSTQKEMSHQASRSLKSSPSPSSPSQLPNTLPVTHPLQRLIRQVTQTLHLSCTTLLPMLLSRMERVLVGVRARVSLGMSRRISRVRQDV